MRTPTKSSVRNQSGLVGMIRNNWPQTLQAWRGFCSGPHFQGRGECWNLAVVQATFVLSWPNAALMSTGLTLLQLPLNGPGKTICWQGLPVCSQSAMCLNWQTSKTQLLMLFLMVTAYIASLAMTVFASLQMPV